MLNGLLSSSSSFAAADGGGSGDHHQREVQGEADDTRGSTTQQQQQLLGRWDTFFRDLNARTGENDVDEETMNGTSSHLIMAACFLKIVYNRLYSSTPN